jgi:NTE family protein
MSAKQNTAQGWDPAQAREKYNLRMSAEEVSTIRAKFPQTASDGKGGLFADGVFEGGGVLGLGFLGAARCCTEVGIHWKSLAGTSAGAITASLLAALENNDDLERLFAGLDFEKFIGKKTSPLIVDFDASDDLDHPLLMLVRLTTAFQLGEYSSDPFRDWLDGALKVGGVTNFGDLARGDPEQKLKVVISNISRGQMWVLPDCLAAAEQSAFSVAEAVRLSMSIPLFFAPGQLKGDYIVDGGILSNYPVWLFDETHPDKTPRWPTFGFRLYDSRDEQPISINHAPDIVKAMLKTMMQAHDRHNMETTKTTRTINVDITGAGITATQFSLTDDQKDDLYRRGYESTKQYLLGPWSFAAHLETRGYRAR